MDVYDGQTRLPLFLSSLAWSMFTYDHLIVVCLIVSFPIGIMAKRNMTQVLINQSYTYKSNKWLLERLGRLFQLAMGPSRIIYYKSTLYTPVALFV